MNDSESARGPRWREHAAGRVLVVAGLVFAGTFLAGCTDEWANARWVETVDSVFEGSVASVSQLLGTPESLTADCVEIVFDEQVWERRASWPLGSADPVDLVGRVESVVESVTTVELLDGDVTKDKDWWDLEGATTFLAMRSFRGSPYVTWFSGGVEDGGRFALTIYGDSC